MTRKILGYGINYTCGLIQQGTIAYEELVGVYPTTSTPLITDEDFSVWLSEVENSTYVRYGQFARRLWADKKIIDPRAFGSEKTWSDGWIELKD